MASGGAGYAPLHRWAIPRRMTARAPLRVALNLAIDGAMGALAVPVARMIAAPDEAWLNPPWLLAIGAATLLLAGLPKEVTGSTVNRLCGSSLDAVGVAARAIKSGEAELIIAGGVESMSRAPFVMGKAVSIPCRC